MARKLENPPSATALRLRKFQALQLNGQRCYPVVQDCVDLEELLLAAGTLAPADRDDHGKVEAALARFLSLCILDHRNAFQSDREITIRFGSDCACPPCEGRCPMARRSDDPLDSVLRRTGRHSAGLSIDDISVVFGDALKNQRQQILGHVRRMIELSEMKRSDDTRFRRNLHARLTAVESEIRSLKNGGSR